MTQLITLTVSQVRGHGAPDGDINAMDLHSKKEACIDRAEAPNFIADCMGWSDIAIQYDDGTTSDKADRFEAGYGVVLTIRSEDWASWLAGYEIVEETEICTAVYRNV
jgi:hypothetical protein